MSYSKTIHELAALLGTTVVPTGIGPVGECRSTGITTDSRDVRAGSIFVARRGAAADGHSFVRSAMEQGASACIVERDWLAEQVTSANPLVTKSEGASVGFLGVDDTTKALGTLARLYRLELSIPTIAITGSTGKTTTKELTKQVLQAVVGKGTSSPKSFNNHVGLPQTILSAGTDDKYLLLEAGMNHRGELDYLGAIAQPDVAAILNVGPAHLEFFGNIAEIADAKCELLAHLRATGTAVLQVDDVELKNGVSRLVARTGKQFARITFGIASSADVSVTDLRLQGKNGSDFILNEGKRKLPARLPLFGEHNVQNALAAYSIIRAAFPKVSPEAIVQGFSAANTPEMRLQLIEQERALIINDAYNANPVSVRAGVRTACDLAAGRSLMVILGEMRELGKTSPELHREIGAFIARHPVAELVVLGEHAGAVVDGAVGGGLRNATIAATHEEAIAAAVSAYGRGTTVFLVKGSRMIGLERVVEGIVKAFGGG